MFGKDILRYAHQVCYPIHSTDTTTGLMRKIVLCILMLVVPNVFRTASLKLCIQIALDVDMCVYIILLTYFLTLRIFGPFHVCVKGVFSTSNFLMFCKVGLRIKSNMTFKV